MQTMQTKSARIVTNEREPIEEVRHEKWAHCHVNWTAIGVGALAAFAMVLLFGLIGVAVGAHLIGPDNRVVDLKKLGIGTLIFSVASAFFSFVIGGWVAGKIAGILHAEPGMLHGAITCLVTVPILVVMAGLGAAGLFGGWYAGLGVKTNGVAPTNTPYVRPDLPIPGATTDEIASYRQEQAEYNRNVKKWNEETPKAVQNSALGALTALLLGLIGSVIGGWMASGEPMNFTHYRTRKPLYHSP